MCFITDTAEWWLRQTGLKSVYKMMRFVIIIFGTFRYLFLRLNTELKYAFSQMNNKKIKKVIFLLYVVKYNK